MITGFENETHELTDKEMKLVPIISNTFKSHKVGEENAVTSKEICDGMLSTFGIKLTGPRVRKIINHIRLHGYVKNLVSSSKGYWVEPDPEKVKKYIQSLEERARAIQAVAFALRNHL